MIKMRHFPVLLVLSSVAVLPACSMGGNRGGGQAAYTTPQPPGVSPTTIARVQSRLKHEGDYDEAIDGIWGPSTEAGVRVYQQQHGLGVTGQLDGATMAALDAPAAAQPAAQAAPATQPYAAPPAAVAAPSQPVAAPDAATQPVAPKTP